MALDPKAQAALALHRFGFGPRAGSLAAIASDPRGALLADLERLGAGQIYNPALMSGAEASRAVFEFNAERAAKDRLERQRREAEKQRLAEAGMEAPMAGNSEAEPKPDPTPPMAQQIFLAEAQARLDAAVNAEIGFVERLVWFWSNHFCISAEKVLARPGGYERERIRAHVLGKFADMLLAVESDPAMLIYLDNAQSIGPTSVAGINRTRGLNENLAREILELHTLGVRTVYSQDDVTSFAKVLTGWTLLQQVSDPVHGGEFIFIKRMHEPGPQTVIGKTYDDTGVEQGRAVLRDLARHPATAAHVAEKLARHFVADEPPRELVDRLAQRFRDSDGDLKEVAKALVTAPEAWSPAPGKIKRPGEWRVAILRATGRAGDIRRMLRGQTTLGEPWWRPPSPKGFSDDNAAWIGGLAQRLDIANAFAQRVADRVDVEAALETGLGPLASEETRQAIARAESRAQALTLLIMAPEFQRR
ncbi:MAG TPA: DUF1800 family protein [Xanthobacteraceae bacterium]|nr:DUF1800 family protein [Xanthobacteraceae bacterium]